MILTCIKISTVVICGDSNEANATPRLPPGFFAAFSVRPTGVRAWFCPKGSTVRPGSFLRTIERNRGGFS